ncbi:succinate dehydrogenase/fumarate reductase iron-sulfur subunit [Nitrosophilus alvini]|uniref:succinate dehydrogenase/fumarate reductase iron-sulfur subunit n=1 Tax=Nitrosophilus alvini TaxID=2714855 RepID=UPI00190C619E|nr:succinate dehydrogenase/fumarate reductase iron-sulfur subunit [Nitrosophilus alvini]
MLLKIKRYHIDFDPPSALLEYEVPDDCLTLLEALNFIKSKKDASLTFSQGCRSGVCGSCAVRVNGKEELACEYRPKDGDIVEALNYMPIIRDLCVDFSKGIDSLKRAKAWLSEKSDTKVDEKGEKLIEKQSDCILCSSCWSSCPVFESKSEFLGPFALTRNWRYLVDARENHKKEKIEAVINNGIWDCTLCGNCTEVCPQGIDPKSDIMMLQSKAVQFGYQNPNFASFGSFGLDF